MATATFSSKGRERAVGVMKGNFSPKHLAMATIQPSGALTKDDEMFRTLTWGSATTYAQTNNVIPIYDGTTNSEYSGTLIFPLAPNRRFSNLTLHINDSDFPLALTFNLEGANSCIIPSFGAIMFVGQITFTFGGI